MCVSLPYPSSLIGAPLAKIRTHLLDLSSVWLFMKINWESFEYKFQPIEERFAHHALVIVRSAGVEALITNLEAASAKQQEEKGKSSF